MFFFFLDSKRPGKKMVQVIIEFRMPNNMKNARLFEKLSFENMYNGIEPNKVVVDVIRMLLILSLTFRMVVDEDDSVI